MQVCVSTCPIGGNLYQKFIHRLFYNQVSPEYIFLPHIIALYYTGLVFYILKGRQVYPAPPCVT